LFECSPNLEKLFGAHGHVKVGFSYLTQPVSSGSTTTKQIWREISLSRCSSEKHFHLDSSRCMQDRQRMTTLGNCISHSNSIGITEGSQ